MIGNVRTNRELIVSIYHKNIDISMCETDADHYNTHLHQRYDCVKCDNLYWIHIDWNLIQPSNGTNKYQQAILAITRKL